MRGINSKPSNLPACDSWHVMITSFKSHDWNGPENPIPLVLLEYHLTPFLSVLSCSFRSVPPRKSSTFDSLGTLIGSLIYDSNPASDTRFSRLHGWLDQLVVKDWWDVKRSWLSRVGSIWCCYTIWPSWSVGGHQVPLYVMIRTAKCAIVYAHHHPVNSNYPGVGCEKMVPSSLLVLEPLSRSRMSSASPLLSACVDFKLVFHVWTAWSMFPSWD